MHLMRPVLAAAFLKELVYGQLIFFRDIEVFLLEYMQKLVRDELAPELVTLLLDKRAKFRMHLLRQVIAKVVLHNKRRAALAGLGVDADNRLVLPAYVRRVDGKVRNLPVFCAGLAHILHALVDCVLMGAGKRGKHQLAHVRRALMDFHVGAALIDFLVFRQVAEIELRVDALRKHVEPYCYDIEVAGALTVAEQRALNPVRSRKKRKLRRGDAASAVVMRMDADNGGFTVWEMADKVFHLVGIGVRGTHFDCIRKIQDDRVFLCRAERFHDGRADIDREFRLCSAEAFRGIFKADVRVPAVIVGQFLDKLCAVYGNFRNPRHILLEYDLALKRRGGVIEVDDDVFCALDCVECFADKMLPCLDEHLNGYVVGDMASFNQLAADFIFRL